MRLFFAGREVFEDSAGKGAVDEAVFNFPLYDFEPVKNSVTARSLPSAERTYLKAQLQHFEPCNIRQKIMQSKRYAIVVAMGEMEQGEREEGEGGIASKGD